MNIQNLKDIARKMRVDIVKMCYTLGETSAHLGGCMSMVELLAVLYGEVLHYNLDDPMDEMRDRVILSKGQGSIAMYAAMHQIGLIQNLDEVGYLLGEGNEFYKQSVRNLKRGIEFSSGSLGQGLAYGVGVALGIKRKGNNTSRVFVFHGDGECDEGSVWEAASLAGHLRLNNLFVIVDRNGLQIDGHTQDINRMDRLQDRWTSFGFKSLTIDGHDIASIRKAFQTWEETGPCAIIADTVKGKGVSFAENQVEWHQNILTTSLYRRALDEVKRG